MLWLSIASASVATAAIVHPLVLGYSNPIAPSKERQPVVETVKPLDKPLEATRLSASAVGDSSSTSSDASAHADRVADTTLSRSDPVDDLVSVMVLTCDRKALVKIAVMQMMKQDYHNIEVVIINDGRSGDDMAKVLQSIHEVKVLRTSGGSGWATLPFTGDESPRRLSGFTVKMVVLAQQTTIGAKRNIAALVATGRVLMHWDDDDLFAPNRIRLQAQPIIENQVPMTILAHTHFLDLSPNGGFYMATVVHKGHTAPFLGSLAYERTLAGFLGFDNVSLGEDLHFVDRALSGCNALKVIENVDSVYSRHANNSWHWSFVTTAMGTVTTDSQEVNNWVTFTRTSAPPYVEEVLPLYTDAHKQMRTSNGQCKAINLHFPEHNSFQAKYYPNMPAGCCIGEEGLKSGCHSQDDEIGRINRRALQYFPPGYAYTPYTSG